MKKTIMVALVVFSGVVFSGCLNQTEQPAASSEPGTEVMDFEEKMESADTQSMVISIDEIAQHSSADDCWMAIEGKVYDVTAYIADELHPGGDAIVQGCGTDATEMFNDRPNGSGAHSANARSFLPNFYVGELSTE